MFNTPVARMTTSTEALALTELTFYAGILILDLLLSDLSRKTPFDRLALHRPCVCACVGMYPNFSVSLPPGYVVLARLWNICAKGKRNINFFPPFLKGE